MFRPIQFWCLGKQVLKILKSSIKWTAFVKAENSHAAQSARIPSDVKVYNLTHLNPATEYKICVDIPTIYQKAENNV